MGDPTITCWLYVSEIGSLMIRLLRSILFREYIYFAVILIMNLEDYLMEKRFTIRSDRISLRRRRSDYIERNMEAAIITS